jgi:hypothetical protein
MNILFDERPQNLLLALAQWYHVLIEPQSYGTAFVNDDC